jgi:stage II sporulation protein E
MKVKDVFLAQLRDFRNQLCAAVRSALDTPILSRGLSCALWLLLGYLMAGLSIGERCAPFGLGLVGAAGPGAGGVAALVGLCAGAVTGSGLTTGLRYAATAVLVYAVSFAFYDSRWYRSPWFMPLAAGVIQLTVAIPLLWEDGWVPRAVVLTLLEGGFTGGAVWCFRQALFPKGTVPAICTDLVEWVRNLHQPEGLQTGCLCLSGAALLAALSPYSLGGCSPARVVGLTLALLLGTYSSPETGACAGALFGLAVDLPLDSPPYRAALFCLSGMAAGLWGRRRRWATLFTVLGLSLLLAAAWQEVPLALLEESALSALLLVLLPRRLFHWGRHKGPAVPVIPPAVPVMTQVRQKLEGQASAFRGVYDQLRLALSGAVSGTTDRMTLFHRASERVCVSCIKYHRCWGQRKGETRSALLAALPRLEARGQGIREDFPPSFAEKCVHFPAFLSAVNQELSHLLAQRQFQSRLRESREAVCAQYEEMAQLLSSAAHQLSRRPQEEPLRTRRVEIFLRDKGVVAQGRTLYDDQGHLMVELLGSDLVPADDPALIEGLSALLALPLRRGSLTVSPEGMRLTLVQLEPYAVSAGIASLPREGNPVSGDSCRWFKGEDGVLRVILCDGMGCGKAAARESHLVVSLLEKLLQGGLEPESALRTVCSALGLRGEMGGGYSTIDLLTIDLFSCQGALYKLGAAPSYLCREGQVHRISGSALPAGAMGTGQTPALTRLPLAAGDTLLLISDGICDGLDDDWLRSALLAGGNLDARSLAMALLKGAHSRTESRDDQTAVVLRISKRLG